MEKVSHYKKPIFCSSKPCKCKCEHKCKCVSPKAGAKPEEEEEAVALGEAGEEGEDQVDCQDVDQTLPPPHLIAQTPPHQRPHHHGHIHQQTCRYTQTQTLFKGI